MNTKRIKLFNRSRLTDYSLLGNNSDLILQNENFGLYYSYQIYKKKQKNKDLLAFKDFLEVFFSKKSSKLPHFLPLDIDIYRGNDLLKNYQNGYDGIWTTNSKVSYSEDPKRKWFTNTWDGFFNENDIFPILSHEIISNTHNMIIIQGHSGAGKTALMMGLLLYMKKPESKLNNYIPIYFGVINNKSIFEILKLSIGLSLKIRDSELENIIRNYSNPLIFFIDTEALKYISSDKNYSIENFASWEEIERLLIELNKLIANTKHRIIVCHRGNRREEYEVINSSVIIGGGSENTEGKQTSVLNKSVSYIDKFYENIKMYAITFQIKNLQQYKAEQYISKISGNKGLEIFNTLSQNSKDVITNPLFTDFINLMALESKQNKIQIKSAGHLYFLFTRMQLRIEVLRLQEEERKNKDHTWLKLGNEFLFDDNEYLNSLNKDKIHPIEIILQEIALELINNAFSEAEISEYISKLFNKSKNHNFNEYLYSNYIGDISKNNIRKFSKSILKNTFLLTSNEKVRFIHDSIHDFYISLSIFYNLNTGDFISLDKKEEYLNRFNKCLENNSNKSKDNIIMFFFDLLDMFGFDILNYYSYILPLNLSSNTFFNIAYKFQNKDQMIISEKFYLRSIEFDFSNWGSHFNLGIIYEERRDFNKAIEMYKKTIAINPNDEKGYYRIANTYSFNNYCFKDRKKAYEDSLFYYKKIIEINPNSIEAYRGISYVYKDLHKIDESIDFYIKYLKLKHSISEDVYSIAYHIQLAETYISFVYDTKDNSFYDKAVSECQKALSINPLDSSVYLLLGIIELKMQHWELLNNFEKAKEYLIKAIKLGNIDYSIISDNNIYVWLGRIKTSDAISFYQEVLTIQPDNFEHYQYLAVSYMDDKKLNESLDCLKKSVELKQDEAHSYYLLSRVYEELENFQQSLNTIKKAMELRPEFVHYYQKGGFICKKLNLIDESINYYNKAILVNKNHTDSHIKLASIYESLNKIDLAVEIYEKALELRIDNNICEKLISIYFSKKDFEKISKVLDMGNNLTLYSNSVLHFKLGLLYKEQDILKSVEHFKISFEIYPLDDSLYYLTLIYFDFGKTDKIFDLYEDFINRNNLLDNKDFKGKYITGHSIQINIIEILCWCGDYLFRKKQYNKSIYYLEEVIKIDPQNVSAYFLLVANYRSLKNSNKYDEYINKVFELDKKLLIIHLKSVIRIKIISLKNKIKSFFRKKINL